MCFVIRILMVLGACVVPGLTYNRALTVVNHTAEPLMVCFNMHQEKALLWPNEQQTMNTQVCDLFGSMEIFGFTLVPNSVTPQQLQDGTFRQHIKQIYEDTRYGTRPTLTNRSDVLGHFTRVPNVYINIDKNHVEIMGTNHAYGSLSTKSSWQGPWKIC